MHIRCLSIHFRLSPQRGGGHAAGLIASAPTHRPEFGRRTILLICSSLLAGCGAIENVERKAAFSVGAEPLTIDQALSDQWNKFRAGLPTSVADSKTPNKDYLGFVASTSQSRCADFVSNLVVSSNATHTGLDMLTTVASALATAFTPLATVHALTAGATISNGWKTAIDADIYAKLTVYSLVQAIQSTYYKDIGNYVDALAAQTDDSIISVPAEITKIQTIHGECTLASAEGTVQASVKPSNPASTATMSETLSISVSGSTGAAVKDKLVLKVQSATIPAISPVQVSVAKGETADKIASDLLAGVKALNLTGVTAKVGSDPKSVVLSWPSSAGISWTPSMEQGSKSGVGITASQPATSTTQAGQPGRAVSQ